MAFFAITRTLRLAMFPVLALWVVAGFWSAEIQPAPASQRDLTHYADGLRRAVQGRVIRIRELPEEDPSGDEPGHPVLSFDVALDAVEEMTPDVSRMVPATGGLRITLTGTETAPALRCGDMVSAVVRMRTPARYRDPGAWQYADYLAAQGIGANASVPIKDLAVTHAAARRVELRCVLFEGQTWAAGRLLAYVGSRPNRDLPVPLRLTSEDAGMLNAMLFGDRDRLSHTLRLGFERTGSFHLFVVSGLHVGLLAGCVVSVARRFRMPMPGATLATIGVTGAYALLVGFGVPVQRAFLMSSIFLIARLVQRDRNVLNSLGAAALGVLIRSPSALFEASFQMTFLVIVAIGGIAIPLGGWSFLRYARAARNLDQLWLDTGMHPRLAEFRIQLRMWGEHLSPLFGRWGLRMPVAAVRCSMWLLELLLIGVVAEMVMVLPMATYFHRATLFALPANVFSIPLVAVLAPMGGLTFLGSLFTPWFAALPGMLTALLLHAITSTISHIGNLHRADWRIPGPSPWIFAISVTSWLILCWLVRRSRAGAVATALLLPVIAGIVLWPERANVTPDVLELTAIDVGQGDSLLLVSPEGRTMLVDAGGPVGRGENANLKARFDVGEDVVSPYLWSRRLRGLDIVALTHAHSDHMGGMSAVLRNFHPRELWVGIDPRSDAYADLLREAVDLGITVRHVHAGDVREFGGTSVMALAPFPGYENHGPPVNNDSLVLRVDYGKASILLEGDAEAASEQAMLAAREVHPVTLLKVGHHGSRTSTTANFFAAIHPQSAIVSVGRNNTFGHPRAEVIERMAAAHVLVYRTDRFGLTQFQLTQDGGIKEIESAP